MRLDHRFRVVDVGATLEPDERADRGRAVGPERMERELHEGGVVLAVVAPGPGGASDAAGGYLAANNAVARRCVERPLVAFARLSGPRDPTSRLRSLVHGRGGDHPTPETVERYAYDRRFHGFVLDPARDGLPAERTLETLGEAGLPVRVHAGRKFPPGRVEATLLGWGFPVVLAGFGGRPLDRELMTRGVDLLERHDDVYVDTCAVRYRDVLAAALREHPDRVLFASGTPDVHPSVAVMELLTLDVPESTVGRALGKNAGRVVPALAP